MRCSLPATLLLPAHISTDRQIISTDIDRSAHKIGEAGWADVRLAFLTRGRHRRIKTLIDDPGSTLTCEYRDIDLVPTQSGGGSEMARLRDDSNRRRGQDEYHIPKRKGGSAVVAPHGR